MTKKNKAVPYNAKISRTKVNNLLKKGLSKQAVGDRLGCSRQTVHNIINEKNLVVAKAMTIGEDVAIKILDTDINVMEDLAGVSRSIKNELLKVDSELSSCDKEEKKDLRDSHIKYANQVLKQGKLLLDIHGMTHQIEEVHRFQAVIMDVIRELAPDAAAEIIKRLRAEQFVNKELLL